MSVEVSSSGKKVERSDCGIEPVGVGRWRLGRARNLCCLTSERRSVNRAWMWWCSSTGIVLHGQRRPEGVVWSMAKQRNGKTGPFYLHWIPETCMFRSVTKE